jgi:hypothetical protein
MFASLLLPCVSQFDEIRHPENLYDNTLGELGHYHIKQHVLSNHQKQGNPLLNIQFL